LCVPMVAGGLVMWWWSGRQVQESKA